MIVPPDMAVKRAHRVAYGACGDVAHTDPDAGRSERNWLGAGVCTAELTEYPVTVPASGERFTPGLAEACATAENHRRGVLVDSRQWCRAAGVVLD
jgi:anti-sigma factor RsiW